MLFLHTLQKDDGYFVVAGLFFILSIFEIDFIRDYGIQKGFYGWISLWPVYVKLKLILVERTFFYINRSMVLHPVRFFKNLGLPPPPDFYVRNQCGRKCFVYAKIHMFVFRGCSKVFLTEIFFLYAGKTSQEKPV